MMLCRIAWLVAVTLIQQSHESHFRGAMMSWKQSPTNADRIDIDYRQAWRRTWFSPPCNDNVKQNRTMYRESSLTISDGSSWSENVPFDFECTDYSILDDWVSGKGHANFTPASINTSTNIFYVMFKSCCWKASINDLYDHNWSLGMVVNTHIRADTGKMNQSPRVDMMPLIRLQYGCNHTIRIPVSDADGDDIRCRWAKGSLSSVDYDECGGACATFTNAMIDERACTITYDAKYKLGWYAVAVQIEDFSSKTSNTVLSSIPLQFLVSVENNAQNCTTYKKERPTFNNITLPDKACVGVTSSTDFTTDIFIDSKLSISELTMISPIGLVQSSLQRINATGTWHVNVKWNPNSTDSVNNVFCFTAVDNNGLSSDQRCVTLLAGVPPPLLIPSTRSPVISPISRYQRFWSIEFDQFGKRPDKPAYVYLYKADGSLVESVDVSNPRQATFSDGVHGTSVRFTTTAPLQAGEEYFIQLGRGVVQGKTYCGAESAAIVDPYFWRFTVEKLPQTQHVTVRCEQRYVTVPCKESDLNCTENWNFANPCNQADLNARKTKFPHPVSADKFILCDYTGRAYVAYCPQGEKFDRFSSECTAVAWDYGLDEPR